jgi:hypothetical protein
VTADLKPIYKAVNEEMALVELDRFEEMWGSKYPLILRSWRSNWDELATFFKYPAGIRKIIYTTNIIESYHRQLRKVTKGKSIFPTDESLLKMLYLRKWTLPVNGRVEFRIGVKCFSSFPFSSRTVLGSILNKFSPLGEKRFKRVYTNDLTDPYSTVICSTFLTTFIHSPFLTLLFSF